LHFAIFDAATVPMITWTVSNRLMNLHVADECNVGAFVVFQNDSITTSVEGLGVG
jgi:hypothetical protein